MSSGRRHPVSVSDWTSVGVGLRSLIASAWRTSLLVAVGLVAGGLLFLSEGVQLLDTLQQAEQQRSNGAFVWIVESTSGGLPADRCSQLAASNGVVAVGGIGSIEAVRIRSTIPARRLSVTPGFARIVSGGNLPTTGAVLVGDVLAAQLGVAEGSYLEDGSGRVAQVDELIASDLARSQTLGLVIAQVSGDIEELDQCLVEFDRGSDSVAEGVVRARFVNQYQDVTVRPLLFRGADERDIYERYSTRSSRLSWLALGVVGGALITLSYRSRRAEIGLLATLGFTRRARLLVVATDRILPLVIGLAGGGALALLKLGSDRVLPRIVFHQIALVFLYTSGVVLVIGIIGFLAVDRRDQMTLLKDL